jgi:hypothetical protein
MSSLQDFNHNRSSWSIRITLRELVHASLMQRAFHRTTSDSSVTWVTRGTNGKRLWICSDSIQLGWCSYLAEDSDPHFALPLPDMFVEQLFELSQVSGDVEIFCNEQEGTIIGRTMDGRYAAVDHPQQVVFTERDLPYLENPGRSHGSPVVAEVSTGDLCIFAEAMLTGPIHRVPAERRLPPFVTISIGDGKFSWTLDWREMDGPRISGAVPATVTGSVTTTLFPYQLAKFLKSFDQQGTAKIVVDGPDSEFAYFVGDDWGTRITLDRRHLATWMMELVASLVGTDVEFDDGPHTRIPDRLVFHVEGAQCFASVHESQDFDRETVRLTHIAARGVPATGEVLAVVNGLNMDLVGATVELRDGEIRVVVETDARNIPKLTPYIAVFKVAVRKVSKMTDFLPLFAMAADT